MKNLENSNSAEEVIMKFKMKFKKLTKEDKKNLIKGKKQIIDDFSKIKNPTFEEVEYLISKLGAFCVNEKDEFVPLPLAMYNKGGGKQCQDQKQTNQ